MPKGSDNDFPSILVTGQGSAPTSPGTAGQYRVYVGTDGILRKVDHSGTITVLGGQSIGLNDLSDCDVTTHAPTDGQALAWNATDTLWEPKTITGGSGGIPAPYQAAVPQISTWTQLNFSHASATISQGTVSSGLTTALSINNPYVSSNQIAGIYRTAPSTPYRIVAKILAPIFPTTADMWGIGYYDSSSGKSSIMGLIGSSWSFWKFNNASLSSFAASSTTFFTDNKYFFPVDFFVAISDDGTNVKWQASPDSVNWVTLLSEVKSTAYLGSSGYGHPGFFCLNAAGTSGTFGRTSVDYTLRLWDEAGLTRTLTAAYG